VSVSAIDVLSKYETQRTWLNFSNLKRIKMIMRHFEYSTLGAWYTMQLTCNVIYIAVSLNCTDSEANRPFDYVIHSLRNTSNYNKNRNQPETTTITYNKRYRSKHKFLKKDSVYRFPRKSEWTLFPSLTMMYNNFERTHFLLPLQDTSWGCFFFQVKDSNYISTLPYYLEHEMDEKLRSVFPHFIDGKNGAYSL